MNPGRSINEIMDEFRLLVNSKPSTEAAEALIRLAGTVPAGMAITAMARLYVLTETRARFEQAKMAEMKKSLEEFQGN